MLSSASEDVLRQSSTASLIAVTVRIKRRGVEANPALVAPKMGNAYTKVSVQSDIAPHGPLTERIMMKRKYMLAILWNWSHKFLGMKLRGVYLAVRILLRVKRVMGWPSSSLASGGSGRLKNILLPASGVGSLPTSSSCCARSGSVSVALDLFDCRLVGVRARCCKRASIDSRFDCAFWPVTRCVAHRILLIGFDLSLRSFRPGAASSSLPEAMPAQGVARGRVRREGCRPQTGHIQAGKTHAGSHSRNWGRWKSCKCCSGLADSEVEETTVIRLQ